MNSTALMADTNLPFPVLNFSGLVANFAAKGFGAREMITLSGLKSLHLVFLAAALNLHMDNSHDEVQFPLLLQNRNVGNQVNIVNGRSDISFGCRVDVVQVRTLSVSLTAMESSLIFTTSPEGVMPLTPTQP